MKFTSGLENVVPGVANQYGFNPMLDVWREEMKSLWSLIKSLSHLHEWYGMEWEEWQSVGGWGTPTHICIKCGERRAWCDT